MHFVHIEDFFHPAAGYQLNLLARAQVDEGHQVTIVTSDLSTYPDNVTRFFGIENLAALDDELTEATGIRLRRYKSYAHVSGRVLMDPRWIRDLRGLEADCIFAHGEVTITGILSIIFSSMIGAPVVTDSHMLEMASENRFSALFERVYRGTVSRIIAAKGIQVIRVVDDPYVESRLGIPLDRTVLMPLGTDTRLFRPDPELAAAFRRGLDLDQECFLITYAGKLDQAKGLDLLTSLVESPKLAAQKDLALLIVGSGSGPAVEEFERACRRSHLTVMRRPTMPYPDLPMLYNASNVVVYPRQCSLSFFDAQACGVPVIFEDNEINAQRVVAGGNAMCFTPGDLASLEAKILDVASWQADRYAQSGVAARRLVLDEYDFIPVAKAISALMASEAAA